MSYTSNENAIDYEKYFLISSKGEISLNPDTCGNDGSKLPEVMEIPNTIRGSMVTSLAPGMFASNKRIKELKLPANALEIPINFCCAATNLQAIHGTESITVIGSDAFSQTKIKEALFPNLTSLDSCAFLACSCLEIADIGSVTEIPSKAFSECGLLREVCTGDVISIGSSAFYRTRIKHALFPNLTSLGSKAFLECAYLETADIGSVTEIPAAAFGNCSLLREVIGKKVVSIGKQAFFHTRSLRELPLLTHVTNVGDDAFFYSRIVPPLPVQYWENKRAFPTGDNETDFWTGVEFTPCCNRIRTKLSQTNSAWKDTPYRLDDDGIKYGSEGCPIFSAMHIHSAISGKHYSHPDEFIQELIQKGLSRFLYDTDWPGLFENVAPLFRALGYHAEVRGNGTNLNKDDYQALVDALADGAYIYSQVCTYYNWCSLDWVKYPPNKGHAVVLYGINELGEVRVLDSNILHDNFLKDGTEPNTDFYTYTMPYQNMVGPGSDFVIVYPPKKWASVAWSGSATINKYTSASKPGDYPDNQVTVCRVYGDTGTPGSKQGILTAYRVGTNAYRTFMPHSKAALYLQIKSSTEDKWLDWTECNRKDFTKLGNNKIFSTTEPSSLPTGVNISTISSADDLERLPEGKKGYLTAYNLFSGAENAREEWQPNGSKKKYIRYATSEENWSDWLDIIPSFTVNMIKINNQNQYQPDKTIEKILAAVNAGASVRCDINIGGIRFLLPLVSICSDETQSELVYGLNMGDKQAVVKQSGDSVTVSLT